MIRIFNSIRHSHTAHILAACILLACGAANAWGTTYTWTGGGGADTSWTNVSNWGGSGYPGQSGNTGNDVAVFGTSPATAVVTIDTAIAISGLNIYNGSSGLVTFNLNGNSISVTSGNFNLGNSGSSVAGHLIMNGSGTVSTQIFDSSQNADCSFSLNTNVDFTVSTTMYADGASGYTTTISGDSSCSFTIPGSYDAAGSNVIVFEGDMIVSSVSGDYTMTYAPSPSPGATVTITVSNSTTSFTTLKYDITVKNATATTSELYKVNGISHTITATNQSMSFSPAQIQTFDVVFPATMDSADGISLVVKDNGGTAIGTLMYYAPSSSTTSIWTGTGTIDWTSGTNWDTVPGAATKYIIINSGTATAGAAIPTGTLTALEKITISSGAVFACNGKDFGSVAMVNNGTVKLSGSETNIGTTTNGTGSTVEYTSGGNTALWGSGSFYNLTIDSGTLICGSNVSVNGTLVNNGIVSAGAENLSFSKYSGTGSVNASSGAVSLTGTTASTIAALEFIGDGTASNSGSSLLTVTSLTLAAASSFQVSASGSGSIAIGSAAYNSADITTVGTVSLPAGSVGTITVTSGSLSLPGNMTVTGNISNSGVLNSAGTVTLSPSPGCTITGTAAAADTTFSALSCSGQGGRTLSVAGYIAVSGTLSLSGTSSASLLSVAGTGTIDLTSGNTTAQYLSIGSGPEITTAVITAGNSVCSTGTLPSGWKFALYTWTGNTDTAWTDKTNWDTVAVPGSADSVLIPDTSSGSNIYPVIGTAVSVQNMTVEAPASVTLSSASAVTVSGTLSNSGTIIYQNIGRITSNGTTAINDTTHTGTVEYSGGSGTITNFSAGTDYYNLIVSGGTWTSAAALAAGGNLTVNGAGTSAVFGGNLSVSGGLSTAGTAAVSFNNTPGAAETTTITGTVSFGSSGAVSFGNDSGDAFTVNTGGINVSSVTGTVTTAGTMTAAAGSPITFSTDVVLAADTAFVSPVALGGSGNIVFTNAAAAAKTVSFDNTFTGNTAGTVSFGATGYPVNGIFGDGTGTDTVSTMASLTVSGTTTVKSSASIAAGVAVQIYNGNVTNNGVINSGTGGMELNGSYNGTSGTLNNNAAGGVAFTHSGTSGYTVSVGTYAANGGTLTFNGTGTGTVSFTPGSSTYGGITVNKSGSGAILDFGTNSFKQSSTASFNIDSGNVTIQTGTFQCGILTINGGTFTQTGANTGTAPGDSGFQYAAGLVNNVSSAAALVWDSGSAGGYLTMGGNVSGTYASSIQFNKKNVTIGADAIVSGIFYDLTIPAGITVINGNGICIRRNLTVASGGTYTKNGQILILGETTINSTTYSSVDGTIADNNAVNQNLGDVVITQGTTTKTFNTAVTADTVTMSDTTASAGAVTFDGLLTVTTLTNGASGTIPSFDIAFDGGTAVTGAVTFYTTGTVTVGNDSADSCIFTGGISHTDAVTMRTTLLGGSLTTSDAPVTFDNLILNADASITTKSLSGAGIIIKGTVTNSSPHALSLTAGTGNIQLTGAVGTPSVRLGAVTIVSAYNVAGDDTALAVPSAAAGALYAASLTQNAGSGTTRLSSADLTGDMNLTVTGTGIAADSTITASSVVLTGGSVDLNGTVTAPSGFSSTGTTFDNTGAAITTTGTNLTINHTGSVMVGAALSSGAGTAGAVTVTSSGGTVTVSGAVTSGAGTITVTGTGSSYAVSITGALSSTTGNIDIDSASTLDISNTITATTGNITIDSSGISSLNSAADITTTTGTVTFGASKGGVLSTAGDITTSGVTSDNSGSITFTNAVTLTGPVAIDTTDGGASTGGLMTFSSTLDSDSAATKRVLSIDAGTGAVICTGAVGSTVPLASLTLTHSGALTFSSALTISGALAQTNAVTGATLFGGSTATAAATSVGSADLNGTSYTVNGKITVTSGSLSVTNSGLFLSAENADIELTSGSFTQDGSGLNQLAGGIKTHASGAVTFATDVYLYGSDTDGMTLGGGGSVTVGAAGTKNLHIAASTALKTITIGSPLTAGNIVLYGGTLLLSADITANADLVLLNGNTGTMYKDSATGLPSLYAYNTASSPSRSGTAVPSLSSFPSVYPDGTAFIDGSSTPYCGAVDDPSGRTLTAEQNFYDNGVDLTGTAVWTLALKDNSTATNAFAEAYNCTIANCSVTCTTPGGSAWVAAAENCTNNGNNTDQTNSTVDGIAFTRPVILVNNAAAARDMSGTANLSGTYTVYDDVVRVEFVDSLAPGTPLKIENSRNEIYKAVSGIQYYSGGSLVSFTGTYTDADCTTSTGTAADGSDSTGDISVFYIKASSTWNTDATGISAGQEDTTAGGIHYDAGTDRSGTHRNTIPCLNLPKALSSVYATLRDCHKNRIGNYDGLPSSNNYDLNGDSVNDSNTAASAGRFTAVADRASPVLIAAYTGQETHTAYSGTAASQPYYDAHNFIEFVYSEAVNIGDLTASGGAENVRAETSFVSGTEHGGSVETAGGGLHVTGIAGISSGKLSAGSRTTGSTDTTVSSLYRTFPLTAGGTAAAQTDRLRVSIAGYVDGTVSANGNSYRNWIGYIDSAETPSGIVTSLGNNFITDAAGNVLADYAAASSTSNHHLNTLMISNTETELYGPWDTSAPIFAPFRRSSSTSGWSEYKNPEYCEAIGNTETGNTTLDRVEFHLFDNTPSFSSGDSYVWFSRRGWCPYDTYSSLYTAYSYASDLFGGSRPFDSTASARTSGGIRYSSVCNSMSAFKYAIGTNGTPSSSFDTGKSITGGAKGTVFSTTTDTYNATGSVDSLYFAVYLSDTTLARKSTFSVSYDADTGFITDLAGNRLKSDQINTLDLTPPEFNMTISPVGNDFLYVVFGKELNLTELLWIDDAGTHTTYSDPLSLIPKSLELVDTSTSAPATGIAIDESTPAVKIFENDDYTGLMFKLSQNTRLTDVENVYLRVKNIGTSTDPVTGISGAYVSYIQDSLGNSMTLYNAHALSDYAVNVVNPQYAYNIDDDSNISDVISSFHSDGSWSVHDWNADQGNYGTLMSGKNILIHAGLRDGTDDGSGGLPANVTAYFDPNPQSNALSVTYNSNTSQNWRIWLPEVQGVPGAVFEALAPINNPQSGTGFITTEGAAGDGDTTYMNFTLAATDLSAKGWKAGDQVKFLFGIMDSSTVPQPVMIRHVPVYNGDSTGGTYSGTEYPLFALRLTQSLNNSDTLESAGMKIASSLDLWSFKLKSLVSQRGGVTILNNVINANNGESTVVKVTMPSDGNLSVVVMTLDGDIVQYLQHGTAAAGEHFYKWNGTTKSGRRVARGMYFIRVFGTGIDETRKVMVVKD